MRGIIIVLLVLCLCLAACGPMEVADDNTDEPVSRPTRGSSDSVVRSDLIKTDEPVEEPEKNEIEVEMDVPSEPAGDPVVKKLLDRGANVEAYKYIYQGSVLGANGNYQTEQTYELFFKGDRIKKVFPDPIKFESDIFYNEVYLDNTDAWGICSKETSILCKDVLKMAYEVGYKAQKPKMLPHELIEDVPMDATVLREGSYDGRKVTIIEFKVGDNFERMYLDNYYGLPLRRTIYSLEDDEELVLEEYTFTKMASSVKNADVTLPAEYEKQ